MVKVVVGSGSKARWRVWHEVEELRKCLGIWALCFSCLLSHWERTARIKGKREEKKMINKCLTCHLKQLPAAKQARWQEAAHRLQMLRYSAVQQAGNNLRLHAGIYIPWSTGSLHQQRAVRAWKCCLLVPGICALISALHPLSGPSRRTSAPSTQVYLC